MSLFSDMLFPRKITKYYKTYPVNRRCFIFLFVATKRKAKQVRENERRAQERKLIIFFFPHHYPLALAVNPRSTDFEEKIEALWTGYTKQGKTWLLTKAEDRAKLLIALISSNFTFSLVVRGS